MTADREMEDPQANPARVLKQLAQVLADLEHERLRHRSGSIRVVEDDFGNLHIQSDLILEKV